jgi:predicted outer membrane protein
MRRRSIALSNRRPCSAASRHRPLGWAVVATLIALAGCGREPPPPAPRPAPSRPLPPTTARPLSTTSYVATAASIDLFHVRAGELALERSSNGRVRDYAARLTQDHRGTASQLSFAGRRLNLLPSSQMAPAHQALLDVLAASDDFDAVFRRQQVDLHQSAQRMHSAYAKAGDSPTLRPIAANAAAVEARHLAALGSL